MIIHLFTYSETDLMVQIQNKTMDHENEVSQVTHI
jgi:hypothetical protein